MKHESNQERVYDATFLHARREALVIILLFATFCCWSIVVSQQLGYSVDEAEQGVAIVAGMPAWVFWGIFVPWIGVDIVAVWFCFFFMADDDLGEGEETNETRDFES